MVASSVVNDGIGDSYVDASGRMVTGWFKLNGKEYYVDIQLLSRE